MANVTALMPDDVEATMYETGRSVSLWVSAFEILTPAKTSALFKVYQNPKRDDYYIFGRGSWIRTNDLQYPKLPRYQAALYPDPWEVTSIHA
jgi:hypothetical protein